MVTKSYKVCFVVNSPDFFMSHRIDIGLELLKKGCEVHIISPGECPALLSDEGFYYHSVDMSRKGMSFFSELMTVLSLRNLFLQIQPDLVHLVTIKPYLYGGIAARLAGVPAVVSAVAGLGILFSAQEVKNKLLRMMLYPLFRYAFGHKNQSVIFQNSEDHNLLVVWGVLDTHMSRFIRGSGVNLLEYSFLPELENVPIVSFASRLLKDKGVIEFVEASRILKSNGVDAEFWLVGEPDEGNQNSVSRDQMAGWEREGLIKILGFRKDIADIFAKSNIVTLPSFYGEGLPKVLIEAAACGRAVVTTNHPGCRDAIEPDLSGILVPTRDAKALAGAVQYLIHNPEKRKSMGRAGRALAEREFAIEKVVEAHMKIYDDLLLKVR